MTSSRFTLLSFLLLVASMSGASAFQGSQRSGNTQVRAETRLTAWSLPTPSASFGSFKSTWYNEYNPTARRTVYDDAPFEFKFVTLGDDWPSVDDPSDVDAPSPELETGVARRRNPLRRAAAWVGRVRRRS